MVKNLEFFLHIDKKNNNQTIHHICKQYIYMYCLYACLCQYPIAYTCVATLGSFLSMFFDQMEIDYRFIVKYQITMKIGHVTCILL